MCQESFEQMKFLCSPFTFSLNYVASDFRLYKCQLSINFSLTCKGILEGQQIRRKLFINHDKLQLNGTVIPEPGPRMAHFHTFEGRLCQRHFFAILSWGLQHRFDESSSGWN